VKILLKRIELKDFRSHKDTKIEFKDGINILSGRNGSGKTSVLYAIFVALFPGAKISDLVGVTRDDLIRHGRPSARVLLEFDIIRDNGSTVSCQVERMLFRGMSTKTSLTVIENGTKRKIIATEAAGRELSELLGINHKIFANSVYVKQGEIKRILEDKERLSEVILEYLEVNKYMNATRNLSYLINKIDGVVKEIDGAINQRNKEIREKQIEIRSLEKEMEIKKKQLHENEKLLNKLKEAIEMLNTAMNTTSDLIKSRELLDGYKKNIRAYEDALKRVEEYKRRDIEKVYVNIKGLYEKYESLQREESEIRGRISSLDRVISEMKNELEALRGRLKTLRGEYNQLEELLRALSHSLGVDLLKLANKADVDDIKTRIKIVEDSMRFINKKCEEIENLTNRFRDIIGEISVKFIIDQYQDIRAVIEKKHDELNRKIRELEDNVSKLSGRIIEIERHKRSLEKTLKSGEAICPVCKRKFSSKDEVKKIIESFSEEINKIVTERENLNSKIKQLEEMLSSLGALKTLISSLESHVDVIISNASIAKNISEYKRAVNSLERIMEIKEQIKDIEERVERTSKSLEDYEKKASMLREKLETTQEELREIENQLTSYGLENIKEAYDRIMKDYLDYLNLKTYVEEHKKDYEESIRRVRALEAEISGIEKELGNVIERIREVSNLDIKPSEGLERIIDALRNAIDERKHEYNALESETNKLRELVGSLSGRLISLREDVKKLRDELITLQNEREIVLRTAERIKEDVLERIKSASSKIVKEAVARLTVYTTEYLRTFIENKNIKVSFSTQFTRMHGRHMSIDLKVIYEGQEVDWRTLSGGEQTALAFSIRLALAKVLGRHLGLLILDEPTENLDAERVEAIRELIQGLQRGVHGGRSQIILVSHERSLRDIENARIIEFNVVREGPNNELRSIVKIEEH